MNTLNQKYPCKIKHISPLPHIRGYAYVEVLIATMVLSLALVPAADALREVTFLAKSQRDLMINRYEAAALIETILTEPFAKLQAEADTTAGLIASNYSDAVDTQPRRIAIISPYDIDNADGDDNPLTNPDKDIVSVSVSIPNTGILMQTIVANL